MIIQHRIARLPALLAAGLLVIAAMVGATGPARAQTAETAAPAAADDSRSYHVYIATFRGCEEVCEAFKDYLVTQGLNVEFTERSVDRDMGRVRDLVTEVRQLRPDLLVTWGTGITLGMVGPYNATDTSGFITDIPTVYLYVGDPVRSNVVAQEDVSNRPNVAGANIAVPLDAQIRAMQSYRDVTRLGVIYGTDETNSVAAVDALREALEGTGIELLEQRLRLNPNGIPYPDSLRPAMAALSRQAPDFIVTVSSSFLISNIQEFTDLALEFRVPVFTPAELPIRQGRAMMALFASLNSIGHVAGYQAEQILRHGADPATLPTQTLSRFSLLINMPVANQLELYPPMLVLQFAELLS